VFFLVDPTLRVPSATDVAPQQHDFVLDTVLNPDKGSLLGTLPVEIASAIASFIDGTMTREEAETYRLKLMKERTVVSGDDNDRLYFGQVSCTFPDLLFRMLIRC
jgi:hypothetical protein